MLPVPNKYFCTANMSPEFIEPSLLTSAATFFVSSVITPEPSKCFWIANKSPEFTTPSPFESPNVAIWYVLFSFLSFTLYDVAALSPELAPLPSALFIS